MRTTLTIDDDVLTRIKALAHARNIPVGKLVTELLRRQLAVNMTEREGFPVFVPPPGSKTITSEDVRSLEDEPW
jgi:hypothetical protein